MHVVGPLFSFASSPSQVRLVCPQPPLDLLKPDDAKPHVPLPMPTPSRLYQSVGDIACRRPCIATAADPLVFLQIVTPHRALSQAIVASSASVSQTCFVCWLVSGPLCLINVPPKKCLILFFFLGEHTGSIFHLHKSNTDNTGIVDLKLCVRSQFLVIPHTFQKFGHYCPCLCDAGVKLSIQ